MHISIPKHASDIIKTLSAHGYEAYVVGGCVRDSILGKEPADWDITTSALPEQVKALFPRTIDTGLKHGTVTIMMDKVGYEVIQDLTDRIIRCVGNPAERFDEDALRMLRAVRFAGQLNFKIEENTKAAIEAQHTFLKDVSAERIQTELMKLLVSGLTSVFLPEFDRMMETPQNNPHHIYSVGDHTVHAVETIAPNPVLRLTMLLHDIAKPETRTTDENGIDHFYNHNAVGADLAKAALKRLKFDNQTTHMVTTLIANHDIRFNDPLGTGRKHVRKIIHRVGVDLFPYLLDVMEADISAQSDFMRLKKLTALKETREAYREILTANDCLTLKDLKINGNQLKALGISEGKMIGAILNALLTQVLNNPELNEYEKLEELALKIYQEVQ